MPSLQKKESHQNLEDFHKKEQRDLMIAILITGGLVIIEILGGILSNSLALFSDAWHMFTDTSALSLCFLAGKLSLRPPTSDKTFGYYRVEILSAFVNGVTLVLVASYIFYEAIRRLFSPSEVMGFEMLTIAFIGLIVNFVSMTILSKSMLSLNVKAAFLHVLGDTLSSIGVVTAGVIIFFTNWYLVDPIMSIIVGSIIVYGTGRMLREALHILLEGVPSRISLKEVVDTMRSIPGVRSVHDVHIWSITSYIHYLSAHIVLRKEDLSNMDKILNETKERLEKNYQIVHTTLQVEPEDYEEIGEVHT